MLPLAHLGIGQRIASFRNRLPLQPVLLGTLLPDLIDKPLYYIPALWTGRRGAELGFFSGTRTAGHSLLFLCLPLLVAAIPGPRRRWWLGLSAGIATHLLLDNFLEPFLPLTEYSSRIALLFPWYGWRFPIAFHRTLGEHLWLHLNGMEIGGEVLGTALLYRLWKRRPGFQRTAKDA